jgi:hypothetical protein
MAQNGTKMAQKMAENDTKWHKMTQNGRKMAQNE